MALIASSPPNVQKYGAASMIVWGTRRAGMTSLNVGAWTTSISCRGAPGVCCPVLASWTPVTKDPSLLVESGSAASTTLEEAVIALTSLSLRSSTCSSKGVETTTVEVPAIRCRSACRSDHLPVGRSLQRSKANRPQPIRITQGMMNVIRHATWAVNPK